MGGDHRADAGLGDRLAVQPDLLKQFAADRMCQRPGGVRGGGVVADQKRAGVTSVLDSLHHEERSRPGAYELHVIRHAIEADVLCIAVGVTHHEFIGTHFPGDLADAERSLGHPVSRILVLEPVRHQSIPRHHSRQPFHVHGDIQSKTFRPAGVCEGGVRHAFALSAPARYLRVGP
jgi:hypothetical protein